MLKGVRYEDFEEQCDESWAAVEAGYSYVVSKASIPMVKIVSVNENGEEFHASRPEA
jgi:hypothetical protein